MAAKINYVLQFDGLDENILKLKELDRLVNSINRKGIPGGNIGGNIPSGGRGPTVISTAGAGAGAGAGEAAAIGAGSGLVGAGLISKSFTSDLQKVISKSFPKNIQKEIVESLNRPGGYRAKGEPSPTPSTPTPTSMLEKIKGMFSGKGIKEMASEAGFGSIGKLIGQFGKFGVAIGAAIAAFYLLHKAIQLLTEGIKAGADAYKEGAKQGINVGSSQNISNAFKSIGMNTPNLENQFGLGKGNDTNLLLQAARRGQFGEEGQQLLNMAKEFRIAMQESAMDAKLLAASSKENLKSSIEGFGVSREWHTLTAQISAYFAPMIQSILSSTKNLLGIINDIVSLMPSFKILYAPLNGLLKAINGVIAGFKLIMDTIINLRDWVYKQLKLSPPDAGTDFKKFRFASAGQSTSPTTAWEKIGFVTSNANSGDHLKEITNNTKNTVSSIDRLSKTLLMFISGGPLAEMGMMNTFPSFAH